MVDRIENRLAIREEKPGARQDWATKPSLSSDSGRVAIYLSLEKIHTLFFSKVKEKDYHPQK